MMGIVPLLLGLLLIALIVWGIKYLFGKYIEPPIMEMIVKVAVVAMVLMVLFWLLALAGVVPVDKLRWW